MHQGNTAFQDERAGHAEELVKVQCLKVCKQIGGHWTWRSCDNNMMQNNNNVSRQH